MKNRSIKSLALDGLFYKNPLLIRLLGLCTAVFACGTLKGALAMGACTMAVLLLSALTLSLLKGLITDEARPVSVLFIVCGYTTAVQLFVKASFPETDALLGIYLPLIAVSGLLFTHGAEFSSKNGVPASLLDALFTGLGYTAAMVTAAALRELFGRGQLFGIKIFSGGAAFLATPAGGFIVLGLLAAVLSFFTRRRRDRDDG